MANEYGGKGGVISVLFGTTQIADFVGTLGVCERERCLIFKVCVCEREIFVLLSQPYVCV